jgi:hypothetical protein
MPKSADKSFHEKFCHPALCRQSAASLQKSLPADTISPHISRILIAKATTAPQTAPDIARSCI